MKKVYRFTASWCGPCKQLSSILRRVITEVPIEVVDIDENMDLAKQFGIRGVPTMVMVEDDVEVKRFSGLKPEQELDGWLNG